MTNTLGRFAAHTYTISCSSCSHLHSKKDEPSLHFPCFIAVFILQSTMYMAGSRSRSLPVRRQLLRHTTDPCQVPWPVVTMMAYAEVGILDTKKAFGGTASNHSSQTQSCGMLPASFGFLISLSLLPVAHHPGIV